MNYYPNYYPNQWMGTTYPQTGAYTAQNQVQQPTQNELMVILVKDDAAVQNYPVANGNSVMLMNYESGKFWIKSMTNGVSPEITEHSFTVVNNGNPNSQNENYVSREDFDALSSTVKKLENVINELNS